MKLYHVFVEVKKAFDRVPRKVIEWALRRKVIPERMVEAVMALYVTSRTRVKAMTSRVCTESTTFLSCNG